MYVVPSGEVIASAVQAPIWQVKIYTCIGARVAIKASRGRRSRCKKARRVRLWRQCTKTGNHLDQYIAPLYMYIYKLPQHGKVHNTIILHVLPVLLSNKNGEMIFHIKAVNNSGFMPIQNCFNQFKNSPDSHTVFSIDTCSAHVHVTIFTYLSRVSPSADLQGFSPQPYNYLHISFFARVSGVFA